MIGALASKHISGPDCMFVCRVGVLGLPVFTGAALAGRRISPRRGSSSPSLLHLNKKIATYACLIACRATFGGTNQYGKANCRLRSEKNHLSYLFISSYYIFEIIKLDIHVPIP